MRISVHQYINYNMKTPRFVHDHSTLLQESRSGLFLFPHSGDGGCCVLFQVNELVDIIEAAEITIRSQVLATTILFFSNLAGLGLSKFCCM